MNRYGAVVAWAGAVAAAAGAASPDPRTLTIPAQELSRAQSLVKQLGSDVFPEREAASKELAKMGRNARPVLLAAAVEDPDPEVRARALRLLPKAAEADLHARIETFLADKDGRFDHRMPGLVGFSRVVGNDRDARDLYVELLKSRENLELLAATARPAAELGPALADRRYQLYYRINPRLLPGATAPPKPAPLTLPDVALVLYAETLVNPKDVPRNNALYINATTFLYQPLVRTAMTGTGPHVGVFRRVLNHWLDTRTDPNELGNAVSAVANLNYKDGARVARRVLDLRGVQPPELANASAGLIGGLAHGVEARTLPYHRAMALTTLAKLGGRDDLASLRGQLGAEDQLTRNMFNNVQVETRVQDIALAMCLVVTDQNPQDYGFDLMQGHNDAVKFFYWNYGFSTDGKRQAALKKWAAWEARQPKAGKK